jgi:Zn-dependent protease/CBS domain-containing protein
MKYSFKIGSAWGVPIELHLTFILLMVAVLVLSYPQFYLFFLVLFLFVFVVIHELAHSAVARHYKIKVQKIVLYPMGGVSEIEEIFDNPRIEWRVAAAGPLVSFVIGAILFALDRFLIIAAPKTSIGPSLSTAGSFALDLALLNLLLGAFNLIPAFPMDGGRVFRAFLAEHMNFSDATKWAAFLGKILGIVMVVVGFVFVNYFLLIVVGIFVYIGATEETESTIVSTTLARVRVRDVMSAETATVSPSTTLEEAMEIMFKARYHDALVEQSSEFVGIVTWDEIMKIKKEDRKSLRIENLPLISASVLPEDAVLEAHKIMLKQKIDLVPVVMKENPNKIVGVLTSEGVSRAYQKAKTLR